MTSVNSSPRHSSRPIGIRPNMSYPREPESTTPPYSSADEMRPPPSHTRPMMMPRPSDPSFYTDPSGSTNSPGWMDPRLLAGTPHPQPAFSPPQYASGSSSNGFSYYPSSYPTNTYFSQPYPLPPPQTPAIVDPDTDSETLKHFVYSTDTTQASPSKLNKPPGRPPNAWIIYRSDMLRAIANGQHLPGLDAVMAESGISSNEQSGADDGNTTSGGEGPIKKVKKKKPKKGSKEPTAGMLTLGKGKTGRGIPQADVSKLISMMWAREQPVVKKQYELQSQVQKREYPDYKFQPMKKADKVRLREQRERERAEVKEQKKAEKLVERHAAAGQPGVKRKTRRKAPASTPYGADMSRTRSGSVAEPKEEPHYSMYPFPMPRDSLPSLANESQAPSTHYAHSSLPPPLPAPPLEVNYHHQNPAPPAPAAEIPPVPALYPTWTEIPDLGPAYAVPFIFEPIPLSGEEFSMDMLQPLSEGMDAGADALAALWCSVEEETEDTTNHWDSTSNEAMQAWSELGSYPTYPNQVELSTSIAEQIAQDWQASQALAYPDQPLQPVYDSSLNYIQVPYYNYSHLPGTPGAGSSVTSPLDAGSSSGPFLSSNQPLSPVEPWSAQAVDAIPFRQVSSGSNRLASSSSYVSSQLSPQAHSVPRHVSSSAFPSTALSVESGGWTDRSVSFSAFAPHAEELDDLFWDDEADNKGMEGGSGEGSQAAPTPESNSTVSPITNNESSSDNSARSDPPRNVRRPRTVGAAFAESSQGGD